MFKFELNERVKYKDSVAVVIGRAQYVVRVNNMYMLQLVEKDIEFDIDITKSFWIDENGINKY